jgi:WD40 repeat protein
MTKSVAMTADGQWVGLTVERGESVLWRPSYPFGRWSLPQANAISAHGQTLVLAGGPSPGLSAQAVVPMLTTSPQVWNAPDQHGLAGAAVSADGRRLAVAGGAGEVWILDAATGVVVAQRTWPGGVAKRPAFSPDGSLLAVPALGIPGIARVDAETLADRQPVVPLAVRRAAWLRNGALAIVPFVPIGLVTAQDEPGPDKTKRNSGTKTSGGDAEPMADAAATPDGKTVLWLGERSGTVWHLDVTQSAEPSQVATVPGGMVVGLSASGHWAVVATATELVWLERNQQSWREVCRTPAPDHRWLSVAVAGSGQWAAASAADGVVGVWRWQAQTPVAWLRGHQGHVSQVLVSPDDHWLWSTGWDGTLRRWQTKFFDPAR